MNSFRTGIFSLFSLLLPGVALAQEGSGSTGQITNPLSVGTIYEFLQKVLNIVVQIGVPIAVLGVIYTGFLFVTAGGNEEQLKKAKQAFFWTVIGAAVLLGAQVLATAISNTVQSLQA